MVLQGIEKEKVYKIGEVLCDPSRPLKQRFRALFTLRNIGGSTAIHCISQCFTDSSALLKHELAYCLGQMQDPEAIPLLVAVLENTNQEAIVRHEAGEALGAIGSPEVLELLKKHSSSPVIEVAETCQLAVRRIQWLQNPKSATEKLLENPYNSIDPAPPAEESCKEKLRDILLDENICLFDRYRAMFTLRNIGYKECVLALAEGLKCKSALFRHEVAYVLGQIQSDVCVPQLMENLHNLGENEMVRHECAEALGAIGTDACMEILKMYIQDQKQVVKESCEVALDMYDYENSMEFQYADSLSKI